MDSVIEAAEMIIDENPALKALDDRLNVFVNNRIGHRPPSHGWEHMYRVSRYSIYISTVMSFDESVHIPVLIVAWLHDLLDSKYESEYKINSRAIKEFLIGYDYPWIKKIIDRISRSREVKFGSDDWFVTIGADGILVRSIVSDADKLDAIGVHGFYRCLDYVCEAYPNLPYKESMIRAINHVDKHLKPLFYYFMKMEATLELALPLQTEMEEHLEILKKEYL